MKRPVTDIVESLFHEALAHPGENGTCNWQTSDWLVSRGNELAGDAAEAVLREVRSLLTAHACEQRASRESGPDPIPTERFGAYRAEALLGRGGASVVYLARRVDGQYQQNVALKVLAGHFATDDLRRRFERERQLLATLNHPNITRLVDGGISQTGDPYLVAELVDGDPLDQYCDVHRLTLQARIRLLLDVSAAVAFAHQSFVLHLDLKPSNILVDRDGHVKLLDFGAASRFAGPDVATRTTGGPLTPRYASPEQTRSERTQMSSDVYSLGVVAYELLCGAWPYGDPGSLVMGLRRIQGEVEPASPDSGATAEAAALRGLGLKQFQKALRGDLSNILRKALEHRPEDRYATVVEFGDDLRRHLHGLPVRATGTGWGYRARRFAGRNRWLLGFATAAAIGLTATSVYAITEYRRAERHLERIRNSNQSFLREIYREVANLPGSSKARVMITQNARRELDSLMREEPGSIAVRRSLAESYVELANLQGQPFALSLGDTSGALDSYAKASDLLRASSDWESRAIAARASQGTIELLIRSGDYREAAGRARLAIEPSRQLWQQAPHSLQIAGQTAGQLYVRSHAVLAHALLREADREHSLNALDEAQRAFEETLSTAEEVRRREPGGPDLAARYSQYIGFVHDLRADFTGAAQEFAAAASAHQRCADSAAAEFQRDPSPRNQRNLADALVYLGWSLRGMGKGPEGLGVLRRALALMEAVTQAEPESQEARLDLAVVYFRLGAVEVKEKQVEEGLRHLRLAADLVPLRHPIQRADRERAVVVSQLMEAQSEGYLGTGNGRAAVKAMENAVAAVSEAEVVPLWRRRELEAELRQTRQRFYLSE